VGPAAMNGRGFTVALIGCDGAGKTTVARALQHEPGLSVRYLYMGVSTDSSNHRLPTAPIAGAVKRARPPSGMRAALRLANRVADEWYRQLLAWAHVAAGRVVVFDRHFHADYHASDIAAAARTRSRRVHGWLLARAYPKPDLVVFLDAPPAVLYARKGEGTPASLARRRLDYLALRALTRHFAVVDAARPRDEVVAEVARIVRAFGAAR
jgi:thymidylate kinase